MLQPLKYIPSDIFRTKKREESTQNIPHIILNTFLRHTLYRRVPLPPAVVSDNLNYSYKMRSHSTFQLLYVWLKCKRHKRIRCMVRRWFLSWNQHLLPSICIYQTTMCLLDWYLAVAIDIHGFPGLQIL